MNLNEFGESINDFDLTNYNTFKLASKCKYFITVNSIIKLTNLIKYLNEEKIKYFVLGAGSNLILPAFYDGVVIKLGFNEVKFERNKIEVGASYPLNKLAVLAIDNNLKGLEWASGIPGTVGGAIIGNAGAYGDEIMNYVDSIEVLENNKIKILRKNDLSYSYRQTNLKNKDIIIIKANLVLRRGKKEELLALMNEYTAKRVATQPLDYPSAGSVFRNPENKFAGKLIEDAHLKGYAIGGAKVSEKHANYIINYQQATSEDIIALINYVKTKVKEQYGIDLILEHQIIY